MPQNDLIADLALVAVADRLLSRERGASRLEIADAAGVDVYRVRRLLSRLRAAGVGLTKIESRHARRGFVYRLATPLFSELGRDQLAAMPRRSERSCRCPA